VLTILINTLNNCAFFQSIANFLPIFVVKIYFKIETLVTDCETDGLAEVDEMWLFLKKSFFSNLQFYCMLSQNNGIANV
jgi:hypothetical protein